LVITAKRKEGFMPRKSHPWYDSERRCYRAYVNGKRIELLKGEENPTNEALAAKQLRQVLKGAKNDVPATLVAHVIERYLQLHQSKYSARVFFRASTLFATLRRGSRIVFMMLHDSFPFLTHSLQVSRR